MPPEQQDKLDLRGVRVRLEQQARQDPQEVRVQPVLLAKLDQPVQPEQLGLQVKLDPRGVQGLPGRQDK